MTSKAHFIQKLAEQLEEWKTEIAALEELTEESGEMIKAQCASALAALQHYYEASEAKLEVWQDSSEDVWEDLEDSAEQQLMTASATMRSALTHIRSLFD